MACRAAGQVRIHSERYIELDFLRFPEEDNKLKTVGVETISPTKCFSFAPQVFSLHDRFFGKLNDLFLDCLWFWAKSCFHRVHEREDYFLFSAFFHDHESCSLAAGIFLGDCLKHKRGEVASSCASERCRACLLF